MDEGEHTQLTKRRLHPSQGGSDRWPSRSGCPRDSSVRASPGELVDRSSGDEDREILGHVCICLQLGACLGHSLLDGLAGVLVGEPLRERINHPRGMC